MVEAVRHGMTNRMIAQRQGVSLDAVKFHVANALAKLGLTRRAELRHWSGVANDSALARKGSQMMESLELGALGQVGRSVRDIASAQHFYGEVLGLPHLYTFGKLAFYDLGGVRLFLEEGAHATSEGILYFRVLDIQAAHQSLAGRGVHFQSSPHLIHRHDDGMEEWMAFFDDDEGRPLAIMAQVRP